MSTDADVMYHALKKLTAMDVEKSSAALIRGGLFEPDVPAEQCRPTKTPGQKAGRTFAEHMIGNRRSEG